MATRRPLARLPEGPGLDDLDKLLFALERDGRIQITQQDGPYLETILKLISRPPHLREDEQAAIEEGIRWVKHKSAKRVANGSHILSRAWQTHLNGDIIDVQFDALEEEDLKSILDEEKAIDKTLEWVRAKAGDLFKR